MRRLSVQIESLNALKILDLLVERNHFISTSYHAPPKRDPNV